MPSYDPYHSSLYFSLFIADILPKCSCKCQYCVHTVALVKCCILRQKKVLKTHRNKNTKQLAPFWSLGYDYYIARYALWDISEMESYIFKCSIMNFLPLWHLLLVNIRISGAFHHAEMLPEGFGCFWKYVTLCTCKRFQAIREVARNKHITKSRACCSG
jgi:hypothetical protein